MCHKEVTVLDAVTAVLLLDTSMDSNGSLVAAKNPLHSTFPDNPTEDYLREAKTVLTGSCALFNTPYKAEKIVFGLFRFYSVIKLAYN